MTVFVRLLRLMRPQAGWMALSILVSALATAAHVALMATSGWFITAMALAGLAGVSMNYFTPAAMIRGFAMIRTAGRYAERVIGHEATLRFVARLRGWLFGRIERAAPANLGDLRAADLLTRLRADIDRLELAFLRVVSPVLAGILVILPALVWLAFRAPLIALVLSGLLAAAALFVPLLMSASSRQASQALVSATPRLNAALVETVDGLAELAIYDPLGLHRHATLGVSQNLFAHEDQVARAQALGNATIPLAAHLGMVLLLIIGIPLVQSGTLAPAELPMVLLLGIALFDAVAAWPLAVQTLPTLLASARRVFELADREPTIAEPQYPQGIPDHLSIQFSEVAFRYPGTSSGGLHGVSLVLEPGHRIAVLGPSGSGKSTLAALAMRFLPPDRGVITANGIAYDAVSGEALRGKVALLNQHDHLFSGTIRDNLLIADPDAPLAALEAACRTAQILFFIETLPEGFDTWVGAHGKTVSGGEARRILLARTLLRRPDILILDEPTEGLDPVTEQKVMEGIVADHPEAGILLLTHRQAGLESMHAVFALEAGRLVARCVNGLASGPKPPHD